LNRNDASASSGQTVSVGYPELAALAGWIVVATVALAINGDNLFVGFDGGYMRDLARRQFEWGVPIFSTSLDYFQGVGDIFFSGLNFTLLPSFIAGSWFGPTLAAKVVTYAIALAEVTFAGLYFARSLRLDRSEALTAALLLPLLIFPFWGRAAIYPVVSLIPHIASFIAASLVLAVLFQRFASGKRSRGQNALTALLFFALLAWIIHAGVVVLVLAGPFLLVCGISTLFSADDGREVRAKLGLATAALLFGLAPLIYLFGILLNSAPVAAPTELVNNRLSPRFASILFQWDTIGPAGPIFICFAILGASLSIFDRRRPILRVFAITFFTYLATRVSFWLITTIFDFWRGPSPVYFEFFVWPLCASYAAIAGLRIARLAAHRIPWQPARPAKLPTIALLAAAVALCSAFLGPRKYNGFPYPPSQTALTPLLESEVALLPPAPFRGRVIALTGRTLDGPVGWHDLHRNDELLGQSFGNEMRLVGLHHFNIPGFFQNASTMTPAFYMLTSRLLADPLDRQIRAVSVLRRYEPRLFAMLGLRFVVTDAPLTAASNLAAATSGDKTMYLYEVPRTNVGNYSPTQITRTANATAALRRMALPDFQPWHEMIADVDVTDPLLPATDGRMSFDGTRLHIAAASAGKSALLLPLEFSRCLAVDAASGNPSLFRANLLLTGLLFDGKLDATITLRTGPFVNPACRLRDLFDLLAMDIRHVPADVRGLQ
jgi:hypothetical protein